MVAAAGGVGAVAVAVRLPGLHAALVQDEVASARILREPTFVEMLRRAARTESTPPLWYAIGWALVHLGVPLVDVRLVSVAAGGLLAGLVVSLAARFVSQPLAVVAGLFPALGGGLILHGEQLRAYELLALLTVLLAWSTLQMLDRPTWLAVTGLAAVVAAGSLTHYFFAFPLAVVFAWLWLEPAAANIRKRATLAAAAGVAVAATWAPVALAQYGRDRFWWIGSFRWRLVVAAPLRLFTGFASDSARGLVVSVAFAAVLSTGALALARRGAAGRLIAMLALGPVLLAGLTWLADVKVFAVRNLIEIAPFVGICVAAALAGMPRRASLVAAAVAVAALGASAESRAMRPAPAFNRIASALVGEGWRPSVPVAVYGPFFRFRAPLEWYLPHRPLLDPGRPTPRTCGTVLVVAGGRRARRLHGLRVDGYTVARLSLHEPLTRDPLLERATVLGDPARPAHCLRLIRHGRRAAIG